MNELTEIFKSSPQAALVGATVYLILTTRRIESRVEELASHIGLAPRKAKRKQWTGIIIASLVALILSGCTITRTQHPDGTLTEFRQLNVSTNDVQAIIELRKLIESIPR